MERDGGAGNWISIAVTQRASPGSGGGRCGYRRGYDEYEDRKNNALKEAEHAVEIIWLELRHAPDSVLKKKSNYAETQRRVRIVLQNGLGEVAGSETQRSGDMGCEIGEVVSAGVEVEFVRYVASGEDFVESGGAGLEAIIVLVAAVKINV